MMTQKARNNLMIVIAGAGILVAATLHRNYSQRQMEANFAKVSVIGQGKPVLLELGGQGCPACGKMASTLDQINKNYSEHFTVAYHDVWKDPSVGEKYGISAIPTLIFIDKDGQELFRHEGILSQKEILAKWKELGVEIPSK